MIQPLSSRSRSPISFLAGGFACLGISIVLAGPALADLEITHLANEGFLVESEQKKVLVDALFNEGVRGYATLPNATHAAAEAGTAPFDGVDLILATHYHADHFDAATVLQHLRSNPKAHFLSTPQAVNRIGALVDSGDAVLERVEAVYPPEGEALSLDRAGIELVVLNLHHGRGMQPPVENLGFVLRMGGLTWLHIGDTEATVEDFRPYSLADESIDVALLPVWFLDWDQFVQVTNEQIQPRHIVVMHLATESAPSSYFGPHGSRAERLQAIRDLYPEVVLLTAAGDSQLFKP